MSALSHEVDFFVLTFHVLDSKFVDKSRREHSGSKCTTEDIAEFAVQTTDAHVFEFEIGG